MTKLLEKAIARARALPPEDQESPVTLMREDPPVPPDLKP
jgi:hypothetical protein